MNKIKNQRGFATFEIILVAAIVGIFSTVAVPKISRTVDKVCLDYEMKHLYSELNLARSISKSSAVNGGVFTDIKDNQHKVEIWVYGINYYTTNPASKNRYQIMRESLGAQNYSYRHNLTNDIELDTGTTQIIKIGFYNLSHYNKINSYTWTLNSKYGDSAKITIDSVGRWRGTYGK